MPISEVAGCTSHYLFGYFWRGRVAVCHMVDYHSFVITHFIELWYYWGVQLLCKYIYMQVYKLLHTNLGFGGLRLNRAK
jgi:hypothetical protein